MANKGILLIGVLVLCFGAAAEGGVDFDVRWVSKYIWWGFDRLDDKGATQTSVDFDIGGGFSGSFFTSYAGAKKEGGAVSTVDATEYRYGLIYAETFGEKGDTFASEVSFRFVYRDFIDAPSKAFDTEELGMGLMWPNARLLSFFPSYYCGVIWPAVSGSDLTGQYGGWIHAFGLTSLELIQGTLLNVRFVYNDGFGGANVDHDWSHVMYGWSIPLIFGEMLVTPTMYYQCSFDDSVNPDDEFYVGVSAKFAF